MKPVAEELRLQTIVFMKLYNQTNAFYYNVHSYRACTFVMALTKCKLSFKTKYQSPNREIFLQVGFDHLIVSRVSQFS